MLCIQDDMCYNKGEEIAPSDIGFQYLMELTSEEKRELISSRFSSDVSSIKY